MFKSMPPLTTDVGMCLTLVCSLSLPPPLPTFSPFLPSSPPPLPFCLLHSRLLSLSSLSFLTFSPSLPSPLPSFPSVPIQFFVEEESLIRHPSSHPSLALVLQHQPWASLIVFGLKRSDGRTWPSEYRGRLWIHSAAHEATPDEITAIEDTLRGTPPSFLHLSFSSSSLFPSSSPSPPPLPPSFSSCHTVGSFDDYNTTTITPLIFTTIYDCRYSEAALPDVISNIGAARLCRYGRLRYT